MVSDPTRTARIGNLTSDDSGRYVTQRVGCMTYFCHLERNKHLSSFYALLTNERLIRVLIFEMFLALLPVRTCRLIQIQNCLADFASLVFSLSMCLLDVVVLSPLSSYLC